MHFPVVTVWETIIAQPHDQSYGGLGERTDFLDESPRQNTLELTGTVA